MVNHVGKITLLSHQMFFTDQIKLINPEIKPEIILLSISMVAIFPMEVAKEF